MSIFNRLSQAILLYDTTYEMGKVYCYLYSSKASHSYNIYLSLCEANNDGSPSTVIATASISASTVDQNGWYSFDLNISGTTPANRLLSFVLWQDGGNEDNYVMWGYSIDENASYAWFSEDNSTWTLQRGIVRALKIVGVFDVFDLVNYDVHSPPAVERELLSSMNSNSATYYHTTYLPSPSIVELDQPNMIVSFVMDSSGSMGWNDRFGNRTTFVNKMVQRFLDYYPANVVFDVMKFGALIADAQSITANMGQVLAINLDINTPTRTTYIFTTDNTIFRVYKGDIYTHNGHTYTAFDNYNQTNTVAFLGDGVPLDVGVLTKSSGGGDESINFGSYTRISAENNSFIALGFKNLEAGHTYNFAGVNVDNLTISGVETELWHMIAPSSESPSLASGNNGPRNSESLDITASTGPAYETVLARSPFGTTFDYANVINTVPSGSSIVTVSNAAPYAVGNRIDLVDRNYAVSNLLIESKNGNDLTFSPVSTFTVGNKSYEGGVIHNTSFLDKILFSGNTIQLYLRDTNVSRNITFFLQSYSGYLMEWELKPFKQWKIYNIYWLGETALLPISVYDTHGVPFPNGTRVDLEVDVREQIIESSNVSSQLLIEDAHIGEDTVYVSSIEGFAREDQITIVDRQNKIQICTIEALGEVTSGRYFIELNPTLMYDFLIVNGATIVPNEAPSIDTENSTVNIGLSMVDVTPIVTGKVLNPSLRLPQDPDPIPPSATYDELNNVVAYTKEGKFDIPTIDGKAVLRILPITEDVLLTQQDKASQTTNLLRVEPPQDYIGQTEQTTGDLENLGLVTSESETVTEKDYTIESPVFLYDGKAESAMTSSATKLEEETFDGLTIPGLATDEIFSLFVKQYEIFPSISMVSKTNALLSKQYFDPFDVFFTPPYNIVSTSEDKTVPVWIVKREDDCGYFGGYSQTRVNGVFAGQEDGSYTFNYIVTNKFRLVPSGTLKIHLYSNRMKDVEGLAINGIVYSEAFLNVKYPDIVSVSNGKTITTPHLSDIDSWRTYVQNNPIGSILETGTGADSTYTRFDELKDMFAESLGGTFESPENEGPTDLFYADKTEWTNATQYDEYDITLNVVDGKATYTLPANVVPSIIFVEASFSFANQISSFESVRADLVIVANPIVVGPLTPSYLTPDGASTTELSSNIQWQDGSIPIDDGVSAELTARTQLIPSVSETDNEWIRGMYIGPHAPYIYATIGANGQEIECPKIYLEEPVKIRVDHLGYTTTVNRIVAWLGKPQDDDRNEFFFKVEGNNQGWADGSLNTANVVSDLTWAENELWVGTDGINRLKGYMQTNDQPRIVMGSAGNLWLTPKSMRWQDEGVVGFNVAPLNQSVGHAKEFEVFLSTSYKGHDRFMIGTGVISLPVEEDKIPRPTVLFIDPLGISIELEEYERTFVRNGVAYANVVASVTWKDAPITNNFILPNTDTVVNYPLPTVTFVSGICKRPNSTPSDDGDVVIDNRGTVEDCLEIGTHPDVSLTSYVVQTGLFRTDISDLPNEHTHACTVDDKGSGITTSTIFFSNVVADHTHTIVDYVSDVQLGHNHNLRCVAITQINPTTNKGLKLYVNGYVMYDPTNCLPHEMGTNPSYFPMLPEGNRIAFTTLSVEGYEPSQPLLEIEITTGRDLHLYPTESKLLPEASGELNPKTPAYFTAENPLDTLRGFDIKALTKFSEYTYEDYPGHSVIIPERIVDDGSRITFEVMPYKPTEIIASGGEAKWKNSKVNIVAPDMIKKYMVLKFRASASAEGKFTARDFYLMINSNLQWVSGIQSLMPELSNDSSYVTTALTQIESIGGSQLHDAVKEATQRIIQEQTDAPAYKDYEKIIMIVSDGDENSSQYSLQQAVDGINFIDGVKATPAVAVLLGRTDNYSEIVMKKYAEKTSGAAYPVINFSSGEIDNLIDLIAETSNYGFNYGTFKNLLMLEQLSLPIEFRLGYVYLPSGTSINYRIRYTSDGETWSSWSSWNNHNVITDLSSLNEKILQFQYEVEFYGNKYFESPILYGASGKFSGGTLGDSSRVGNIDNNELPTPIANGDNTTLGTTSGPTSKYYKPQSFIIFFKPISAQTTSEEYVSAIHITHEATIPENSEIQYGIVQSGDLETAEYMAEGKYINSDTYTILLTRYNEKLITTNNRVFTALNGRWPHSCNVEVYRFNSQNPNGIIVDASEYAANSLSGEITFYSYQSSLDKFTINVIFKPFFRLIAKITNYGEESAVIHHIGVIYNTCKRVPTDINGNIIHKPISDRLES
jgi:hypothetical protein